MKCTTSHELLLPYVDGELDGTERGELERHLRGCEACRGELERTRALAARLAAANDAPVDVDAAWGAFQERLSAEGAAAPGPAWWRRWWWVPVPVAALAGAALTVALLGDVAPGVPDEVRLVQHLDLLEALDCLVELPTLERAGLLEDPAAIERALEEVGG